MNTLIKWLRIIFFDDRQLFVLEHILKWLV